MKSWLRITLALIAGVFASGLVIAGVEMLAHTVVEGTGLFVAASIGLGVGAIVGGTASSFIAKNRNLVWVVGGALGALSLINVFSFEHPVWFVPVAFLLLGLGCFVAFSLSKKWSTQA